MNSINTDINIKLNRKENHLNIQDSYLEIEFVVSDNAVGVFANDANVRLVNYNMVALFSSVKLESGLGLGLGLTTTKGLNFLSSIIFYIKICRNMGKMSNFNKFKLTYFLLEVDILVVLIIFEGLSLQKEL